MCSHLRGSKRDSYLVPEQDTSLFFLLFPNCRERDKNRVGPIRVEKRRVISSGDLILNGDPNIKWRPNSHRIHVYRKRGRQKF